MAEQNEKREFDLESFIGNFEDFRKFAISFFDLDESLSDEELIIEAEKKLKVLTDLIEEGRALIKAREGKG